MAKEFYQIFESFSSVMELLRNEKFQDLLMNYERAKKTFIIGYEVQDEVSSEIMILREDKVLKPEDYLIAFSKFVRENETAIDAIAILLNRPKNWNTNAPYQDILNQLIALPPIPMSRACISFRGLLTTPYEYGIQ